jgi:predicted phage-related endonuclease
MILPPIEIIECEQGTAEWHAARCGIVTASEFSSVMAKGKGKTRLKYMRTLAAQIITETVEDQEFTNRHLERGNADEADARSLYEFAQEVEVQQVGFLRRGRIGCSPDGLIRTDGALEMKSRLGHLQIELLESNAVPPAHKAQIQGVIWVADRKWLDFMSYSRGLKPFIRRVERDEAYIENMAAEIERFLVELNAMVEKNKVRDVKGNP